jgi:hypothetical protein
MKHVVLVLAFAAVTTPVFAQDKPLCVDASQLDRYNARPLSLHTVVARNAFGADKRAVKLDTTCIHVDRAATVSLHSFTRCIAIGDDVVTAIPGGGHREICRVTGVTPLAESYGDPKYSYN